MRALQSLGIIIFLAGLTCLPVGARAAVDVNSAGVPVVVFPLQELGERRNEVNLPYTVVLADRLRTSGNEITRLEAVIAFLANNRIRTAGHLESYHLSKVREELGAPLVLMGTITQNKERPEPSLGVVLQLVRTTDARTVWSYVGSLAAGDDRRAFGVGEAKSVGDLWPLLLDDIVRQWPWKTIGDEQRAFQVSIDTFVLNPGQVAPGREVRAWVRLRNVWPEGRAPRIFFKADDQLYPATATAEGNTYEATWVAGEKNGRFPVTLILDWPVYGRREAALLGNYVVDGTAPLFEIELRGVQMHEGMPVFRGELNIVPRPLVRKPLARWKVAFFDEDGALMAEESVSGNLPARITWHGQSRDGYVGDGTYRVVLEAWDQAGNVAKVEQEVVRLLSQPQVNLALAKKDESVVVDLDSDARVPLAFWRMEMWTREGKLLTHAEGTELPAQVGFNLADADQDKELQGYVIMQDILGNRTRKKVQDLLPKTAPKAEVKKDVPTGVSESWVDGF